MQDSLRYLRRAPSGGQAPHLRTILTDARRSQDEPNSHENPIACFATLACTQVLAYTARAVNHFSARQHSAIEDAAMAMLNTRKLAPGQNGAKKLQAQYGDRLLCVRYRYDRQLRKRYKTVELIVEEADWTPPSEPVTAASVVGVRVEFKEAELQRRVKAVGGKWNPARKLWELRYDKAVALGLKSRVETPARAEAKNTKVSDTRNR